MAACLADNRQVDQVTGIGICHGLTGLWHTARRIAADAPEPQTWTGRIRDALRPRLAGYLAQHHLPDTAGLLEGSAGLELIDCAELTGPAPAGDWDACLLLTIPFDPGQAATGSAP